MQRRIPIALAAGLLLFQAGTAAAGQGPTGPDLVSEGVGLLGAPDLLGSAQVQSELKLTPRQLAKVKRAVYISSRQREAARLEIGQGGYDPDARKTTMEAIRREYEGSVSKILEKPQRERLVQLALRREGLLAAARPEVARKLELTSSQSRKIKAVVDAMRQPVERNRLATPAFADGAGGVPNPANAMQAPNANGPFPGAAAGFGPFAGAGAAPGFGPTFGGGPFAGAGPGPGFGPPPTGGRDPQGNGVRDDGEQPGDRLEKLEAQEKARENAVAKIAEILTPTQKEAFDRLLGKPVGSSEAAAGAAGEPPANGQSRPTRAKSRRGTGR